jgi:hypothetical protein
MGPMPTRVKVVIDNLNFARRANSDKYNINYKKCTEAGGCFHETCDGAHWQVTWLYQNLIKIKTCYGIPLMKSLLLLGAAAKNLAGQVIGRG